MCQKTFSTFKSLEEIQSFIVSLELPVSKYTALDISLVCFEMSQNSMLHGGSRTVEIEGNKQKISIKDFSTKEFNPLVSSATSAKSQGLKYLRLFLQRHQSITLSHDYSEADKSNVFSILLPAASTVDLTQESCVLTISGRLLHRYNNDLEEQLRLLSHCPEVLIDINYGNMASSFVIPTLEAIFRISVSRKQKVIIRTTPSDLVKEALLEQLSVFATYHPEIREIVTIQ